MAAAATGLGCGLFLASVLSADPPPAGTTVEGRVLPFQEVVVSSPLQEVIERIDVKEGDTVEKGQVLAQLDATLEELGLRRAERVVEKREFENQATERLIKNQLVSEDEALSRRIELDIARLDRDLAEALVRQHRIASPLSGIVAETIKEAGESVTETEAMFRIINIDQVYVQIHVAAEETYRLAAGQEVSVEFPDLPGERVFQGRISFIDPRIDGASGLLRVKVLVPNNGHVVRAGMRGAVRLPPSSEAK